jgi:hypothetical protein
LAHSAPELWVASEKADGFRPLGGGLGQESANAVLNYFGLNTHRVGDNRQARCHVLQDL